MEGRIKIVGTNLATKQFKDVQDVDARMWENERRETMLHFNGVDYWLQNWELTFKEKFFFILATVTDGRSFVGRLAFEFYPKSS